MGRVRETLSEFHVSSLPILGWSTGAGWMQMSPVALLKSLRNYLPTKEETPCCDKCAEMGLVLTDTSGRTLTIPEFIKLANERAVGLDSHEERLADFMWLIEHVPHE